MRKPKSTEQFKRELAQVNPKLVVMGDYVGARDKIAIKSLECGHLWEAIPTNLLRGSGCPYCSGLLPIPGISDLATANPSLSKQWHPTKNGELTPCDVKAGSEKRVWWICEHGHEWQAPVKDRNIGDGCPYCSNKKVLRGFNDLATINPELASQWHPNKNGRTTPEDVTPGSSKKVWWCCNRGHEWEATIASRSDGRGCPYCSNKKVLRGFNDLATVDPLLATEWSPRNEQSPEDVASGSSKRVWWRCEHGHEWRTTIQSRRLGHGCPYCAGLKAIAGVNDLATLEPDIARQWHPTKNGDLTPSDITSRSGRKVWWQCERGHEWRASPDARHSMGCPYCSGHRVLVGFNDLATVKPDLVAQWHPSKNGSLTPASVTAGSGRRVWWQCEEGHEWRATICDRSSGTGCPYCSGRKVLAGFNDLGSLYPEIAAQWHPEKNGGTHPDNVLSTSTKQAWWLCNDCGHEWKAPVWLRTLGWAVCPACKVKMHGTSFPEQALVYYLRRDSGLTVEHRAKVPCRNGERLEVDIWIPSLKTGVEYDGIYYHEKRREKDDAKADLIRSSGMRLLRIIEGDRFELDGDDIIFDIKRQPRDHQNEAIRVVFETLGIVPDSPIDLMGDRIAILAQYKEELAENSLAALAPLVAEEWDYDENGKLTPDKVSVSSNIVAHWRCKHGHSWEAQINHRTRGSGCPYCSGRFAIPGENDLETLYPELASQWHPTRNGNLAPSNIKPGSGKKVWWLCDRGHEWEAVVHNRAKRGQGCPYCSGCKVAPDAGNSSSTKASPCED